MIEKPLNTVTNLSYLPLLDYFKALDSLRDGLWAEHRFNVMIDSSFLLRLEVTKKTKLLRIYVSDRSPTLLGLFNHG